MIPMQFKDQIEMIDDLIDQLTKVKIILVRIQKDSDKLQQDLMNGQFTDKQRAILCKLLGLD